MVCRHCGYENSADARYCAGCGRRCTEKKGLVGKLPGFAVIYLLVIGIVIGILIPKFGRPGGETAVGNTPEAAERTEILQVLPMAEGAVAVLYDDGTVTVSGDDRLSEAVSDWSRVKELQYVRYGSMGDRPVLAALTEDGALLTSEGDPAGWSGVEKLRSSYEGFVGVTGDGRVLAYGTWEDASFLTDLTDVEDLVYGDIQSSWGCLRKDGSVCIISEGLDPWEMPWTDVQELRDSGHAFYVIKKDGSVDGGVEDTYIGLKGAVKIVDYNDWIFGMSAEGQLLTHSGGNIYSNLGHLMVGEPGKCEFDGEEDISRYCQVRDLTAFGGLLLLNKDGTVDAVGYDWPWDLSTFRDIRKIVPCMDPDSWVYTLYGICQDGSVTVSHYDEWERTQSVAEGYRDWKLRDVFPGYGGAVGLTTEGKLVGDGIYADTDFSVFR